MIRIIFFIAATLPTVLLTACSSNTNAQEGVTAANSAYEVGDEITFAGPDGETLGSITVLGAELLNPGQCLDVRPPAISGVALEIEISSETIKMPTFDYTSMRVVERDGSVSDGAFAVTTCTGTYPWASSPPVGEKSRGFISVGYSTLSPIAVVLNPTFTNDDADMTDVDNWYTEATPSTATVNLPS